MGKIGPAAGIAVLVAAVAAEFSGVPPAAAQGSQPRAIYVSVLDKDGAPVPDLQPTDIVVREDNVAREILQIAPATEPMQIAILVDDSQAAEPHIRDYREAIPEFIKALTADTQAGSRHEIALITLGERPTIKADYTVEPQRVLTAASRIFATTGSGTYLLDAMIEVSQGIVKRRAPHPVIVAIVTEGVDLSNRHYKQVLEPLEASGAAFHVIVLGRPMNQAEDRSIVLAEGPRLSGGSYDNLLLSTALTSRLKQLAAELTHQFRVTYARPDRLIPPERVTVTAARPGLTVRGTAVDARREQGKP
jgi:hypothetical protein